MRKDPARSDINRHRAKIILHIYTDHTRPLDTDPQRGVETGPSEDKRELLGNMDDIREKGLTPLYTHALAFRFLGFLE